MNNLAKLGIGCGVCAAAVTIPVVTLSKRSTDQTSDSSETGVNPNGSKGIPRLTKATDIKEKYKQINCLSKNFGEIDGEGSKNELDNNSLTSSYVFDYDMRGCLTVEYYKKKFQGDKGLGEFRLVLAFSTDAKGFITAVNARTENDKLKVSSTFYSLTKEGSSQRGDTKKAKENEEVVVSGESQLSQLIPRPGTLSGVTGGEQSYGGFDPDLNQICKTENCGKELGADSIKGSTSGVFKTPNSGVDHAYKVFQDYEDGLIKKIMHGKGIGEKEQCDSDLNNNEIGFCTSKGA